VAESPRLVAVIDIDGVLADVRHRLHHIATMPKDWSAFFAAAPDDPVLTEGFDVAGRLGEVYEIVYLSGRPEECRRDTESWLTRHDLPPGSVVLRAQGDRRPARLTKVEALKRIAETSEVVVLVDDDPEVCRAAMEAGYDVLPADWMERSEALTRAQEDEGRT
jgi:hypothetical protein